MTSVSRFAFRFRWLLIIPWLICMLLAVGLLIYPAITSEIPSVARFVKAIVFFYEGYRAPLRWPILSRVWRGNGWLGKPVPADLVVWAFALLFVLMQLMLFLPGSGWIARMAKRQRPKWPVVLAAALITGFLTAGTLATILQASDQWHEVFDSSWQVAPAKVTISTSTLMISSPVLFAAIWVLLLAWLWKHGTRFEQINVLTLTLGAASLLLVIFSLTIQRRSTISGVWWGPSAGSYTGLIFAGTVLLWAWTARHVLLFAYPTYER